jgi:hypothetical protein
MGFVCHPDFIWFPMLASVFFIFFNFRKKARGFAGDVGSRASLLVGFSFAAVNSIKTTEFDLDWFFNGLGVDTVLPF